MVKKSTKLFVANRCGVWWTRIFHIFQGSKHLTGRFGNFVKVSVRDSHPDSKLKKKTKVKSLLVRLKKQYTRVDGTNFYFYQNSGVLLKRRTNAHGSELLGPTLRELRRRRIIVGFSGLL